MVNLVLQYLTHAVGVSSSWKLVKPHITTLLTNCVFPLMCFDDEDAELWEDDPQEYIRKVPAPIPSLSRACLVLVVAPMLRCYYFLQSTCCKSARVKSSDCLLRLCQQLPCCTKVT